MEKLWIVVVLVFVLAGCSIRLTADIVEGLQPSELYESFDVKPVNLKNLSKCPNPPSVRIVNTETREGRIDMRPDSFHVSLPINPKELTVGIVDYLKSGFKKSRIEVDDNSPKTIEISLKDAIMERGMWVRGGKVQLQVRIPEIRHEEVYTAKDNHYRFDGAMIYAIHKVSRQVIDDPIIQDYILCK